MPFFLYGEIRTFRTKGTRDCLPPLALEIQRHQCVRPPRLLKSHARGPQLAAALPDHERYRPFQLFSDPLQTAASPKRLVPFQFALAASPEMHPRQLVAAPGWPR